MTDAVGLRRPSRPPAETVSHRTRPKTCPRRLSVGLEGQGGAGREGTGGCARQTGGATRPAFRGRTRRRCQSRVWLGLHSRIACVAFHGRVVSTKQTSSVAQDVTPAHSHRAVQSTCDAQASDTKAQDGVNERQELRGISEWSGQNTTKICGRLLWDQKQALKPPRSVAPCRCTGASRSPWTCDPRTSAERKC